MHLKEVPESARCTAWPLFSGEMAIDHFAVVTRKHRNLEAEFYQECPNDPCIERAETTGMYGKPAEHWQRFRDAIQNKTARRPAEKLTRRGKSVALEMDID